MPVALTRASPMTLERTDEILAALARALPSLEQAERQAALLDADRLLDIRLALSREAGE